MFVTEGCELKLKYFVFGSFCVLFCDFFFPEVQSYLGNTDPKNYHDNPHSDRDDFRISQFIKTAEVGVHYTGGTTTAETKAFLRDEHMSIMK